VTRHAGIEPREAQRDRRVEIQAELGLDDSYLPWLATLASAPMASRAQLPDVDDLSSLCQQLEIPGYAAAELAAVIERATNDVAIQWLLDHSIAALDAARGSLSRPALRPPQLPRRLGAIGRCFHILVFLASVPAIRRYHRLHAVPDDISWATLADLGRHIEIHHRISGGSGLQHPGWLELHELGLLYELGRLQFNRDRLNQDWADDSAPFGAGDFVLGTHIPESGPLRGESCIESFTRARAFFHQHFPAEPYRYARCQSWLLDNQLIEYLPGDSNILTFQRMFIPFGRREMADREILYFVFRVEDDEVELDRLPQRTTLERAVVAHLRLGGHWHAASGYREL